MAVILNKDPFTYQQEHEEFLKSLRQFHSNRGTPFDKIPRIGGREVDLYLLYRRVISFGGWRKIVDESLWEQILRDFEVPKGCSNGTQALKFIYVRYLDIYEKVHFHGVDPKQPDMDEDNEGPLRKKVCLPQFGIPHSYNYEWHRIHDSVRAQLGMSTDILKYSDYDKLEKSLLSGLPNEVDFVINVCTLLSNESRHTLVLEKSPRLLQLLMAHVGVHENDKGSYESVHEESWRSLTNRNFVTFWMDTVKDDAARQLVYTNHCYKHRELLGSEVLNLGRDQGLHDIEGQRVMQIAVIMRNLSFEEENMKFMTQSDLVFRFLMLCIHSSYGCLRQLALDTLANIAEKFDLCPDDNTQMVLQLVKTLTGSDDKYDVVRGLEMVSKLCLVDSNDTVLGENLEDKVIEDIVRLMNVFDIQIIVSSLEALYQLSELGEQTTTKIAAVRHAVDLLVTLLSIEAQSYGPNSLVGIKVVEYCPPPHLAGGIDHSSAHPVAATPVTQALPPSQKTSQHQIPGTPSCDVETTTCTWLHSTFEPREGVVVSQVHMYAEYINFAKKFSLPQILPSQAFFNCVKMVYPDLQQYSMEKPDGLTENGYRGICKRKVPLPITLSSTVGLIRHRASSVVHPPNVMSTPNHTPSPTVDLTQTPTLRQRLMEPPKLSALQASPSLLPIGGATVSKQQSAIYTSSKPVSQTQTSASLKVQVTQAERSQTPKRQILRDSCGKFISTSKNLHQHILKKQNMMKKQSVGTPMSAQTTGVPQNTGLTQNVNQLQGSIPGPCGNQGDTNNVKNLLAKKLRTQTPVPIAPKGSQLQPQQPPPPSIDTGGNPMHLLTFTTQQSSVIQGQLQQNLSPQPYIGIPPQQLGIAAQQTYVAQNYVNSPQQTVVNPPQTYGTVVQSQQVDQNQVQIHGIQSVVDGAQQYIISHSEETAYGSSVSSSQSSHRSRSPKSDKSKKKSDSPNRSASRSSSPKGHSPKRQSSTSSRSSSPRSASPKNLELEVCGEVERAKDVVQVGLEARIERVENRCLNQIKEMTKNQNVIPMPSTSNPISSNPSSQNIILPVIVGSTNTGQTGNFIPSCPSVANPSDAMITNAQSVLTQQNAPQSAHQLVSPSPQERSLHPAQSSVSDTQIKTNLSNNQTSVSQSSAKIAGNHEQTVVKQDSLSSNEESIPDSKSQNEVPAAGLSEGHKPQVKYVCSQDETEAAVSSLLITNDEETQQSISNGSDGDLGMSAAVVNAPDETEAAISAITGLLEEDNNEEEEEEDMDDQTVDILLDTSMVNTEEEQFIQEEESQVTESLQCVENGKDADSVAENGKAEMVGESVSDMCTKQSEVLLNGSLESPGGSDIIPSPISDNKCHINGIEGDLESETKDAMALNKLAAEKLAKINGITRHIGNGDFDQESEKIIQKVENGVDAEFVEGDEVGKAKTAVVPSGDSVRVNGCNDVEMEEKLDVKIDNVMEIAPKESGIGKSGGGTCYELASEADTEVLAEEGSDEVIIENEMCLQPTVAPAVEPETKDTEKVPKSDACESAMTEESVVNDPVSEENQSVAEKDSTAENPASVTEKNEESQTGSDNLPDVSTGCVDILKAAIESEKIDELDLNGDSNDSLPVVTEGIYQTGIQMTVQNGHIPIGNEMTTTVGANNLNLIPNVFTTVQTGLVVGTIVSINNNILTTSNVPLPYVDNINPPAKVTVNMEICPNNRHIPTPETSRDGELSCDSIASSITESSDKHSISIQQPIISVHTSNIQTSGFLSVQTIPAKQTIITTTNIPTGPSQTSPRSTRSSERRSKKRSRSQSGGADSRCSSSPSPAVTPPISQPAIQPPLPELMCEWTGCKKCFENTKSVFNHVFQTHLRTNTDGVCRWEGCERLQRKKWSLVTHIQDHHCSDTALRVAAIRRIQSLQSGVAATPTTVPALVYPPDAAWQAIRRFEPKPPYAEFSEQREGPVTKHIRLTAALVLRNLARYSSLGRSMIKKHERHINFMAMSALESSNALANCLWEVLHDH